MPGSSGCSFLPLREGAGHRLLVDTYELRGGVLRLKIWNNSSVHKWSRNQRTMLVATHQFHICRISLIFAVGLHRFKDVGLTEQNFVVEPRTKLQ